VWTKDYKSHRKRLLHADNSIYSPNYIGANARQIGKALRINNAVKFSSANFAGLTFGAMYGFSNSTLFAGTPTTTAGTTTTQGASSTYSFGANYAQGPFGIGAAYTNIHYPNGATHAFSVSIANVNTGGLRDSKRSASARATRSLPRSCGRTGRIRSSSRSRANRRS
jgi:predicted porin